MACKTIVEKIGDHEVSVMQLSATQALDLESRLAPAILQGIVPIVASLGQDDDTQMDAISTGLAGMVRALPPKELASLIRELCSQVMIDGQRVEFDAAFSGGDGVLLRYQIAWFVLRANFSGFFEALLPAGALERAAAKFGTAIDQTSPESTGGSGASS